MVQSVFSRAVQCSTNIAELQLFKIPKEQCIYTSFQGYDE